MNVLLTCAGRRSFYVTAFRKALVGRGRVLACDSSADAPALEAADAAFTVPQVGEDGYVEALLEICSAHRVGLLVPILEPELPLLATSRRRFDALGTQLLVSSAEAISTCYDKVKAARFLAACGFPVPRTYSAFDEARAALARGEVRLPLIVKPRWGVGSIGVWVAETVEELEAYDALARKQVARSFLSRVSASDPERSILIQELVSGAEYGLDVVNDLGGRYVATLIRRKLRMRDGQTDRAVTVHDGKLESVGRLLGKRLEHVGPLDCDVFVTRDGACVPIDLNPRIGGGYPFCHVAGANLPAALVAWAEGETPGPGCLEYEAGVTSSRADAYVIVGDRGRGAGSGDK
ncbi:MAG: ATP-grasp domain-containing protein [Myxococcales bacterium]